MPARLNTIHLLSATALALAALCLFAAPVAIAHPLCPVCMPPDKVTIQGPSIAGTADITDASVLAALGVTTIPGLDGSSAAAQSATGASYEITRYYNLGTAGWPSYWTDGFDHFRYFPGAAGHAGVFLYEGATRGDTQRMASALGLDAQAGRWLAATPEQDAALRALVASATGPGAHQHPSGAPLASAISSSRGSVSSSSGSGSATWPLTTWLLMLGAASLALLSGTLGLRLRRRWVHAPTALAASAAETAPGTESVFGSAEGA